MSQNQNRLKLKQNSSKKAWMSYCSVSTNTQPDTHTNTMFPSRSSRTCCHSGFGDPVEQRVPDGGVLPSWTQLKQNQWRRTGRWEWALIWPHSFHYQCELMFSKSCLANKTMFIIFKTWEAFWSGGQFVKSMRILYTSIICISSEMSPSLSQILPILGKLQQHFTVTDEDSSFTQTIEERLWYDLSKRYQVCSIILISWFFKCTQTLLPLPLLQLCFCLAGWEHQAVLGGGHSLGLKIQGQSSWWCGGADYRRSWWVGPHNRCFLLKVIFYSSSILSVIDQCMTSKSIEFRIRCN